MLRPIEGMHFDQYREVRNLTMEERLDCVRDVARVLGIEDKVLMVDVKDIEFHQGVCRVRLHPIQGEQSTGALCERELEEGAAW